MNPAEASREIAWNISHTWVMYPLFLIALGIAAFGVYRRVRRWLMGQPIERFDSAAKRTSLLLRHAVIQVRLARETYAGVFHRMIFGGFVVLIIATTVVLIQFDFKIPLMKGYFYLYFQSLAVDICGLLLMIGIGMAALQRWILKPSRLVFSREASLILLLLFTILFTGFLLEGWRIAGTADPWAGWSPVGNLVAEASRSLAGPETLRPAHRVLWWSHMLLAFGLLAYAPYTKMIHVLTSALNIYTANLVPIGGNLKPLDLEEAETLGVKDMAGFTWKDLADLDACTECGRCADACPAHTMEKALSPRDVILELRTRLHQEDGRSGAPQEDREDDPEVSPLVAKDTPVSPDALWTCTTCAACVEVCPVYIEQMPKIVDLRRYLVMEESDFPVTLQEAVMSVENRGHPFRGTQATRLDWAEGLAVRFMVEVKEADVLLWVGSTGALLERNQKVTRALAQLLERAGVDFSVLGREEKDTGDLARRVGNEYLFESLALENIETLGKYKFKSIVTACPHDYNTLKNEYPRLEGHYQVFHHTEYLARLVQKGALSVSAPSDRMVTYHDPCYLGRHNGILEAPRSLVRISSQKPLVEMGKHRELSFCCGGGGGMNFMEEPPEERVNRERARHALETDADTIVVACPTCLSMLEDGINGIKGDRDICVKDIAELLWEAVGAKS